MKISLGKGRGSESVKYKIEFQRVIKRRNFKYIKKKRRDGLDDVYVMFFGNEDDFDEFLFELQIFEKFFYFEKFVFKRQLFFRKVKEKA